MDAMLRSVKKGSSDKEGLAGEHAFTDIGQMVLFAVFLTIWITDSFFFHYSVFFAAKVPASIRIPAGIAISIASALLALSAHKAVFSKSGRESGLITTGVYSYVRHPMYLGSWLFSVGLALTSLSLACAAVSLGILLFYFLMAKYEERLLLAKFGTGYRKYQSRVPMMIPVKFGRKC